MPSRMGTPSQSAVNPAPMHLQALISSTTYPKPFTLDQLEYLKSEIQLRRSLLHTKLVELDPGEEARMKREKKERKQKERERLAEEAEAEQRRLAGLSVAKVKRERSSISPAPSLASAAGTPGGVQTYGGHHKKKKKRVVDSEDEGHARDRSVTVASPPHPSHHVTTSGLKVKLPGNAKGRASFASVEISYTPSAVGASAYGANIDFSLPGPSSRPLIPPRPGVQKPLPPGPKKQSEVNEDFSNTKAPTQVNFPTFWAGIEPYVREIREDDLAMLGFKADVPDLYTVPPRGRHYTEVWDEEDGNPPGTTPRISVPNLRQLNGTYPPTTNIAPWIPAQDLKDENLVEELKGLGNITERVIAAVVPLEEDQGTRGKMAGEYEVKEAERVNVKELEEKVKKELRAVMLLGEHEDFDPKKKDDDEVTASLRTCQRLLVAQTALNDARRLRLAEKAKHRLAYAEYQHALDGVESNIEESWAKRTKRHGHSSGPKKNAHGKLEPRPPVPEALKKLVQIRKNWVDSVGARMKERPRGEMVGLPAESVFTGIGGGQGDEDEDRVEGVVGAEADNEDEE